MGADGMVWVASKQGACIVRLGAAVLLVLIVVSALGCGDDSTCRAACERPFSMAEEHARRRVGYLQSAPDPWPGLANAQLDAWLSQHQIQKAAYVERCAAECDPDRIVCDQGAVNISEWVACGR